jgi:E3 ubiquitin-protein ligase UBR1
MTNSVFRCGGNIGLFINIRKCMVLFLNQKRYDALLRKVWLEGGIQSLIARRLEGDLNNGGWETL